MKVIQLPVGELTTAFSGIVANSRSILRVSAPAGCNHTASVSSSLPSTRLPQLMPEAENDALQSCMRQASQEIISNPKAIVYGGVENDRTGRRPTTPYDINCGYCEEWGERVADLYREVTGNDDIDVIDPGNLSGNPDDSLLGHVFIRFRSRYYDAECPIGVEDWRKLPLFIKQGLT